MFDKYSRETIEECLRAAEHAMQRAGIETVASRTELNEPHGFVNLAHFDDDFHRIRMYRPGHGIAPFQSFIRVTPPKREYHEQTFHLLTQLKKLEPSFRKHLADEVETPEVTETYVKEELRHFNKPVWPDELYYNLTYKADEVFRNSTSYIDHTNESAARPRFVDLSEIAPLELQEVPSHLRSEHAIKNAIDLVCMGPWAGISVAKIIRAFERLYDDLTRGKRDVEPPILQCLEPGVTRRLTIPLWRAGRFHGVFSVIMGGSLEQLGPLDNLESECWSISHLLFSVLQRERERRARSILRSGLSDRPLAEVISEAAHALSAPHHIRHVSVTDGARSDNDGGFGGGEIAGAPLQFSINEKLFGRQVRVDVELFDEKRPIIRDLMKIYISSELRRINWELTGAAATADGAGEGIGNGPQSRADIEAYAYQTLENNRNESSLPIKEYCLCFISLAILDNTSVQVVRIFGQKVQRYQTQLTKKYRIFRKQNANRKRNPAPGNDPGHLYLSHLCTDPALKYVQKKLPGLTISRDRNKVEIRFRNG